MVLVIHVPLGPENAVDLISVLISLIVFQEDSLCLKTSFVCICYQCLKE